MKKSCWKDSEVLALFNKVEDVKKDSKPLKSAFVEHAVKYGRKPNSVRNYYYFQLEQLKKDIVKSKKLGIDLKKHEKNDIQYFSPNQESKLIENIESLVKKGYSVRKACLELSGGDLNLMLRYQNKYRNFLLKNQKQTLPNNIISFSSRQKPLLSDADINSLFLGLVRLVKRSAVEEFSNKLKDQKESANQSLRQMLVDLNKKDKEIDKLKEELVKLKLENSRLVQNMMKIKCEKVQKLKNSKNLVFTN